MRRKDFKQVTQEYIKCCEKMVKDRTNTCSNTLCEDCPFHMKNITKGFFGCSDYGRVYFQIEDEGVAMLAEKFLAMAKGKEVDDDTEMSDEDQSVLIVEYAPCFDDVCIRIKYQNTEILKRGEFYDNTLAIPIKSGESPCFGKDGEKILYIRGWNGDYDNRPFIVSREDAELINKAVRQLNKKYEVPQMWRAEIGGLYYYIDTKSMKVCSREDRTFALDTILYKSKNYFQTEVEAEQWLEKIKGIFEEYGKQCIEQGRADNEE